jgi:hypothetical protein
MSHFTKVINNCSFTFTSKFVIYDILFVNLTTSDKTPLTFARSNSECGMWRLCVSKKEDTGTDKFYLQKGFHYTMSTFIILELQMFLNSILNKLPDIKPSEQNCNDLIPLMDKTIYNKLRGIEAGYVNDYSFSGNTIHKVCPYKYDAKYINYHPVEFNEYNTYVTLKSEDKQKKWPPEKSKLSVGYDKSINYGETAISLLGNIYNVVISDDYSSHLLFYMIYSINIETPDTLNVSERTSKSDYYFDNKIKVKNFFVPVYAIPVNSPPVLNDITKYGLYNHFSMFRMDDYSQLQMCKILDYINNCHTKDIYKPTCTTTYKFTGAWYNEVKLFVKIKRATSKTLSIIQKWKSMKVSSTTSTKKHRNTLKNIRS